MNKELENKYLKLLQECIDNPDGEMAHEMADGFLCNLLIELGYEKVVEKFLNVNRWYG